MTYRHATPPEVPTMRANRLPFFIFACLVAGVGFADFFPPSIPLWSQSASLSRPSSAAPAAPVRAVTDDYYGTRVTDPYRYMENLNDPEVQSWLKAQDNHARAAFEGIPGRVGLLSRIEQLDKSAPTRV